MAAVHGKAIAPHGSGEDMELAGRILARDSKALRIIMRRNNQRLYRIARSVIRNDSEAEDIVQEAYVLAFTHLDRFRGDSSLTTWLSRIVVNEALDRLRKSKRTTNFMTTVGSVPQAEIIQFPNIASDDPERTMAQQQILQMVERTTDNLPDLYRSVFVARVIEKLNQEETTILLELRPETVKTRLHRARALVRRQLDEQIGPVLLDAFPFAGRRCERMISAVLERLGFSD